MVRTVLAIDPGNVQSGFVLWDGRRVITAAVEPNDIVRDWVSRLAHQPMGSVRVDALAIEQIGHYGTGMAAGKTVFDTCIEIGRLIECWMRFRDENSLRLVKRQTIKTHLCGTPRAKDANVAQSVRDRVGKKGTIREPGPTYGVSSHALQALALALYVCDVERIAA